MLRRRIFSSAMASVMALSSIAVVANAEETAVANVKTKDDLDAYVKSFDTFRASDIYEYGSISGEQFLNAIEYADNVLADAAASAQDYTVAYNMIESIYNRLKIYSVEELKALLATAKGAYDRGNVLNEDLNDLEYKNDKGQYDDFASAYSAAESVLDSSDSRLITDAYETLDAAYAKLSRMTIVTKAQFRTALKNYEAMLAKEFEHEAWRRGSFADEWNGNAGNSWWMFQNVTMTYGGLFDYLESLTSNIYAQYEKIDEIKTLNKTSEEDVVKAYNSALEALEVIGGWKADDTDRAVKANVTNLLDKYHSVLVFDYDAAAAEKLYSEIVKVTVKYDDGSEEDAVEVKDANTGVWAVSTSTFKVVNESAQKPADQAETIEDNRDEWAVITKTTDAAIKIRNRSGDKIASKGFTIYIPVDKEGYWDSKRDIATGSRPSDGAYVAINKGKTFNIVELVRLDASKVYDAAVGPKMAAAATTTSGETLAEAIDAGALIIDDFGDKIEDAEAGVEKANAFFESADFATTFKGLSDDQITEMKKLTIETINLAAEAYEVVADVIAEAEAFLADATKVKGLTENSVLLAKIANAKSLTGKVLSKYQTANGIPGKAIGMWSPVGYSNNEYWSSIGCFFDQPSYWDNDTAQNVNYGEGADTILPKLEKAIEDMATKGIAALPNTQVVNSDDNGVIDGGTAGEYTAKWGAYVAADSKYQVDLEIGMTLANMYLTKDKDEIKAQEEGKGITIYDIDTNDIIGAGKAAASTYEWTLIHRYLKYALEDKYNAPSAESYTKADVVALIDKAYELSELTGDAALFEVSHVNLANNRREAVEWLKAANKDKMYKDWNSYGEHGWNATAAYKALEGTYKALENEYNAFKYSFGEIAEKIYLYEDMIDAEELEATDALLAAIEETSYRLATVGCLYADGSEMNENDAFSTDRFFQGYNRVYTKDDEFKSLATANGSKVIDIAFKDNEYGPNASHKALKEAFEALEAEVKKQTEVTVLLGDVNGDGVVNAFDASALLKNIVNSVEMDAAVADYDASGVVNALDASAILKAIVNA